MRVIQWIDERLRDWASWCLTRGQRPQQSPLASMMKLGTRIQGVRPNDPTFAADAWAIEKIVAGLPAELCEAVRTYYLHNWSMARCGRKIGCSSRTVKARIDHAHDRIASVLNEQQPKAA